MINKKIINKVLTHVSKKLSLIEPDLTLPYRFRLYNIRMQLLKLKQDIKKEKWPYE